MNVFKRYLFLLIAFIPLAGLAQEPVKVPFPKNKSTTTKTPTSKEKSKTSRKSTTKKSDNKKSVDTPKVVKRPNLRTSYKNLDLALEDNTTHELFYVDPVEYAMLTEEQQYLFTAKGIVLAQDGEEFLVSARTPEVKMQDVSESNKLPNIYQSGVLSINGKELKERIDNYKKACKKISIYQDAVFSKLQTKSYEYESMWDDVWTDNNENGQRRYTYVNNTSNGYGSIKNKDTKFGQVYNIDKIFKTKNKTFRNISQRKNLDLVKEDVYGNLCFFTPEEFLKLPKGDQYALSWKGVLIKDGNDEFAINDITTDRNARILSYENLVRGIGDYDKDYKLPNQHQAKLIGKYGNEIKSVSTLKGIRNQDNLFRNFMANPYFYTADAEFDKKGNAVKIWMGIPGRSELRKVDMKKMKKGTNQTPTAIGVRKPWW